MAMKYLNTDPGVIGAECGADAEKSNAGLLLRREELMLQLQQLGENAPIQERADVLVELGLVQLDLEQKETAWQLAKQAFQLFVRIKNWEGAVAACNIMFLADQADSLQALGHAVWLGVTYPIDAELSVAVLEHLVDETPDDSDGGAVAAATACYLAELRAKDKQRENLIFFTNQILAKVARRHSKVEDQEQFDAWMGRLELNNPDQFIPRLGQVVDVLVQGNWWIDRDALRAELPAH